MLMPNHVKGQRGHHEDLADRAHMKLQEGRLDKDKKRQNLSGGANGAKEGDLPSVIAKVQVGVCRW